jgi:hypothetical protein
VVCHLRGKGKVWEAEEEEAVANHRISQGDYSLFEQRASFGRPMFFDIVVRRLVEDGGPLSTFIENLREEGKKYGSMLWLSSQQNNMRYFLRTSPVRTWEDLGLGLLKNTYENAKTFMDKRRTISIFVNQYKLANIQKQGWGTKQFRRNQFST